MSSRLIGGDLESRSMFSWGSAGRAEIADAGVGAFVDGGVSRAAACLIWARSAAGSYTPEGDGRGEGISRSDTVPSDPASVSLRGGGIDDLTSEVMSSLRSAEMRMPPGLEMG